MSLYLYAPTLYSGTRELQSLLQARRLVKHDGMHFLYKGVPLDFGPTDGIVCWGAHTPAIPKVACLNASYEYPRLVDVNIKGGNRLMQQGFNVYAMNVIKLKQWYDSYPTDVNNWYPKKSPANRIVAIPDLEGYGFPHVAFNKIYATVIFGESVITGPNGEAVLSFHKALGLDFAQYHMADHKGEQFLLRISTTPNLDATDRQVFANKILAWAEKNGVTNAG